MNYMIISKDLYLCKNKLNENLSLIITVDELSFEFSLKNKTIFFYKASSFEYEKKSLEECYNIFFYKINMFEFISLFQQHYIKIKEEYYPEFSTFYNEIPKDTILKTLYKLHDFLLKDY